MLQLEIITENKDLASISKLYWEIDSNLDFVHKVGELAELAKIDKAKLPSVVRESCHATISDWKCSNCGEPFVFSGRSEFTKNRTILLNSSYRQYPFLCASCEKIKKEKEIEEKKRQVEATRKASEIVEIETRKKIRENYALEKRSLTDVQKLSLTDAVYLISILRGGAYENLAKIIPVSMFEHSLSSDEEFSTEIIKHLYQCGLIYVHPDTEPEAFEKDNISTFYIYKVYYAPPLSQTAPDDPKVLVTEMLNRVNGEWSEEWCQEALKIWKKIALSECKEYLLFVLNEHHFEFSPGEKTTQYLEYALEHYSTAQLYNTIWRAAKDAAAYCIREGVSKRQAANVAIASIQKTSERAIAENWEIKPFGRNYKCPQALVSEVFYNSALKLGDEGFQSIPNIETIRTKKSVPPLPMQKATTESLIVSTQSARALSVFLCHSSSDKPMVRELYKQLKSDQFDPWLDEEKLLPGQDWRQEIPKAVRKADVVIICLSRGSINKEGYVQKEITFALDIADEKPEGSIFLIPLKLEECEVPERLSRWHWVNYFDKSGYKKLLDSLHLRAEVK